MKIYYIYTSPKLNHIAIEHKLYGIELSARNPKKRLLPSRRKVNVIPPSFIEATIKAFTGHSGYSDGTIPPVKLLVGDHWNHKQLRLMGLLEGFHNEDIANL